jgi:preprotein translocase subunit SecD
MLICTTVGAVLATWPLPSFAQEPRILTVRQVESITNPSEKEPPPLTDESTRVEDGLQVVYAGVDGIVFELAPAIVTENHVTSAVAQQDEGGEWLVNLSLTEDAAARLENLTGHLACLRDQGDRIRSQLAIVVDRTVVAAHELEPEVGCGTGLTDGRLTVPVDDEAEADRLATRLGGSEKPEEEEETNPVVPAVLLSVFVLGIVALAVRRFRS